MYMYESHDNEEVSLETRQVHTCIHPRFLFVDVDEDEDTAEGSGISIADVQSRVLQIACQVVEMLTRTSR